MRNIQEVFNQIQEKRGQQREIKKMYKDAVEASGEYRELLEKIDQLKVQKKQLEVAAWEEIGTWEKYETTKLDIKQNKEMLTDIAISTLMSGETVKVVDEDNNEYEPKYSVSFQKTNVVRPSN
jgi:predicted nuclease with TOPRIM domain